MRSFVYNDARLTRFEFGEGFFFGRFKRDEARQTEQIKKFGGLSRDMTKDDARLPHFRRINDAEQVCHADAVDQIRILKIYHQRATTLVQIFEARTLKFFAVDFVQIISGMDEGDAVCAVCRLTVRARNRICRLSEH